MKQKILTVTLNPCLDKTISLNGFFEGGLNRADSVRSDAGGKGINVAKVLKGFGADVMALGVMGDKGSEALLEELARRGIDHDFLFVPGTVRTNYKLFDSQKGQVTEVNEPGFSVAEKEVLGLVSLIEKHLPEAAVMVLAGSMAPGIPKDMYQRLITLAQAYHVKVILDADGEALSLGLLAKPYAIKPNRFELEQLSGKELSDEAALLAYGQTLLDSGVGLLCISLGGEGALFMTPEAAYRVTPSPIVCQSTVGAGDSMVAAIAYSNVMGKDLATLSKMATAAGSVTASKPGTEVCTLEEVLVYQALLVPEKVR
ncbi:MAG: 1-phosphofructokinase [Clostridia bacterium]|nr:1-phosphofructokinase [Clostridia bacterium]